MNKEPITYQQQSYDYVRDQIINLGFKPGEYITDAQIAEKLNISRTPVREAFQRLEKEGLLVNEAHHGWQVYKLDLTDIHEIFDLKIAVEGMLIRRAAECRDENLIKDLHEALADMRNAVEAQDADYWLRTDFHLHNVLLMMANNERAEKIVNNLNDQWHRLRLGFVAMQGMTQKSIMEHELFVKCVLAQDADGAEAQMRAHLSRVRDDLIHLVVKVLMPYNERGF
jgi:DNA-binding GntR family transcriptional regulator